MGCGNRSTLAAKCYGRCMTPPNSWPEDYKVESWNDLCIFLGGSDDSFTGQLLLLVAKADPGNRAKLRSVYPREVAAWEVWGRNPYETHAELTRLIDEYLAARPR